MQDELHIIIGGAGTIGRATIDALRAKNKQVISVGRAHDTDGVENRKADMLIADQAKQAVAGATHVYLCLGLPYDTKTWQRQWPVIMQNTIDACAETGAKLIFFDNAYLYSRPLPQPFTEDKPQVPATKKGRIRKQIADMLLAAHKEGKVRAVIGRSADFYGPHVVNSQLYVAFLERILEGKHPFSLYKLHVPHTYAYVPDAGRALVRLAFDDNAYGEAWHLPVGDPITIAEIAEQFNLALGTRRAVRKIPGFALAILSLFIPILREAREMSYQFNQPYIMSSQKFLDRYPDFIVTPNSDGLQAMAESFKNTAQ